MRLRDRIAIVVGAGLSPGEGIDNGRAFHHADLCARRRQGAVRRSSSGFEPLT